MSQFSIYTTGGELVEGGSPETDRARGLISDLGVIPPWQACFCDPEDGLLIHIFTAKKRNKGSATRKANNYYAVYIDSTASQMRLFDRLATELESRFIDEKTGWERVSSEDHIKSKLSDPTYIQTISKIDQSPMTISERGFVSLLEDLNTTLQLHYRSTEALSNCIRLAAPSNTHIRYATELDPVDIEPPVLNLEYTNTDWMDTQTAAELSKQIKKESAGCRRRHTDCIESSLEKIDLAIAKNEITPATAVSNIEQIRASIQDETSLRAIHFDEKIFTDIKNIIDAHRIIASEEVREDIFDKFSEFGNIKNTHISQFNNDLSELLTSKIQSIQPNT